MLACVWWLCNGVQVSGGWGGRVICVSARMCVGVYVGVVPACTIFVKLHTNIRARACIHGCVYLVQAQITAAMLRVKDEVQRRALQAKAKKKGGAMFGVARENLVLADPRTLSTSASLAYAHVPSLSPAPVLRVSLQSLAPVFLLLLLSVSAPPCSLFSTGQCRRAEATSFGRRQPHEGSSRSGAWKQSRESGRERAH